MVAAWRSGLVLAALAASAPHARGLVAHQVASAAPPPPSASPTARQGGALRGGGSPHADTVPIGVANRTAGAAASVANRTGRPAAALAPPEAGRIFDIGSNGSSDPRGSWRCLEVRPSLIPGAGRGLFVICDLQNATLLGEYRGERFLMGEHGANARLQADWSYIWKVPRCLAPPDRPVVLTRGDRHAASNCSSAHGFVYVDAQHLDGAATNPLRFVNGIGPAPKQGAASIERPNTDVFFADDRVFYYTARPVRIGEELVVDYGAGFWKEKGGNVDDMHTDDSSAIVADVGDFIS